MNIQLDSEMMKGLVSEALMKALDQEKRDILIQSAIKHLVTPEDHYGSRRESPLESAFRNACHNVAQTTATEMLTNDPAFQARVRQLLDEAMVRVMDTNREATIERLAEAIAVGMTYRER